jgi:hypothetical protein
MRWSGAVDDILTTRDLLDGGYDKGELQRLVRRGSLQRLRRGAYVRTAAAPPPASREEQHRRLVAAVTARTGPEAVVSHGSAAVLHGLPVWSGSIEQVHVTRSRSNGAKVRGGVAVHGATLPPAHVADVDGVRVTALARTVVDLARTLPIEQAVAAGDRAVTLGLDFADVDSVLLAMEQWPGIRQARRVVDFLDGRSESVGESVSRVRIWEQGLPIPIPQREIYDAEGTMIARVDFAWDRHRTVGEFDGRVKYGRLLRPDQSLEEVLFAEKLREDALRDAGWQVVRWIWADLYRPGVIGDRVRRAFARSR